MLSPQSAFATHTGRRRGLGTVAAAVLIILVLVVMSVGTYAIEGGFSPTVPTSCSPPTSAVCNQFLNLHDLSVLVPFKSVSEGSLVSVTASLPQGESSSQYTFNFGDTPGAVLKTSSSSIVNHTYTSPGSYIIYATANVNGVPHDNLDTLVVLGVSATYCASCAGSTASVTGNLLSNSSSPSGTEGVTAVLSPDQSVTVSGSYTSAPTNPSFSTLTPKIITSTGGSISAASNTSTSAQATAQFPTAGTYTVTFVGSATNGSAVVYDNYTWSVFVSQPGTHAAISGSVAPQSPHPGTIVAYELAPGGGQSEDPAIDYETVGAEPIFNIYQTLITYNGTDVGPTPNEFVPVAATCVPGSAQCANIYGGDNLTNGVNFTFVIQRGATFYDPTTGASWGMYPTDVMFSIARDLGFSTLPAPTIRPGWIVAQALLNPGNESWNPIHGAYNNTPMNILGSMTINGSDCPAAAMTTDHGCITFDAYGSHHAWPDFLELVADPLGAGIVPCGWFSASSQAAGVPYWTRGNISGAGDQPCPIPGGHLQDGRQFGVAPSQMPAIGWDQWEQLGSGSFNGQFLGNVQWNMLGSGPYYLASYIVAASYTLKANPAYGGNPYCTYTGCEAQPGNYAKTVEVTWENTETPGEQAYRYGAADLASIPSTEIGLLLQLIQEGKVNALLGPTLNIGFTAFNMNFYLAGAQHITTNPITVSTDFFSYLGMREFFSRAYPYQTIQNTINTRDGIELGFLSGGAIPQFMGNYYPRDIPWPNTNPCTSTTNSTCPSYWWAQMQDPSSPYYDPEVVHCTSSNPCELPIVGTVGNPAGDQVLQIWTQSLNQLSGRALDVQAVDIPFLDLVIDSEQTAGTNPLPIFGLGWAPDFPDPTDYVTPLYAANSTYTEGDAVAQALEQPQFAVGNGSGCSVSYKQWNYWANLSMIPQTCQGVAYRAMLVALNFAATDQNLAQRVQVYNQAEKIAYGLCLYAYGGQSNAIYNFASWVDINSVNQNVMTGGDAIWSEITGNGVQGQGST
jgi:hypothetical protein